MLSRRTEWGNPGLLELELASVLGKAGLMNFPFGVLKGKAAWGV